MNIHATFPFIHFTDVKIMIIWILSGLILINNLIFIWRVIGHHYRLKRIKHDYDIELLIKNNVIKQLKSNSLSLRDEKIKNLTTLTETLTEPRDKLSHEYDFLLKMQTGIKNKIIEQLEVRKYVLDKSMELCKHLNFWEIDKIFQRIFICLLPKNN